MSHPTGFDRIFDCPAGRRILAQTRSQPKRDHARTNENVIDWMPSHPADAPPAAPAGEGRDLPTTSDKTTVHQPRERTHAS